MNAGMRQFHAPAAEQDQSPSIAPTSLASPIRSKWPVYSDREISEVVSCLQSGRVNALHHGDRCRAFEKAFADRCGRAHGIAVANGTLALELALRAFGITHGDEVIVPARSFMASASCVAAVGATPVFADVDLECQGLTAANIAEKISGRSRAIIVVHLAGWPCPMDEIMAMARRYGLKVIEDCAQSHGASLDGREAGSFGDAAAFSFCTDKIISTGGEGGLLLLDDAAAWKRAWAYKDHGKSPDPSPHTGLPGSFRWLHESIGSNYRLTEMQAGIGLRQLEQLDAWLDIRRRNAMILNQHLTGLAAVRLTLPPPGVAHAYYKYYAFVRPEALRPGWSRDRIVAELIASGMPAGSGSCPEIYREAAFRNEAVASGRPLVNARLLGETSMMFPVDPTLDEADMQRMGATIANIIASASA
jgi:dTDP-4-amino-4,6-dideoxygalactose transaminase